MVKLHVKRGDQSQFLYETTVSAGIYTILEECIAIYNGRLKVERICDEIPDLVKHGPSLPPNMQGLTDEQITELKLVDEFGEMCISSGGFVECKDPMGRRNGKGCNEKMADVLNKTASEAKASVSKKQVDADICVTKETIKDALDMLKGALMIAFPMGLPKYDLIRMELENREDLSGTHASQQVLEIQTSQIWWAGKHLQPEKLLQDYVGKNEKTKIVVKLSKSGSGAPAREPVFTEEQKKQMMLDAYRKQEELKQLEGDEDNAYLNSEWADKQALKRNFHGLSNIGWRPH